MAKTPNILSKALVAACIVAGLLMITGCTGSVSGKVYLDNNGNGELDAEESGVPYAKLIVTRDGEMVARHYADRDGVFDIPIKQRAGYLCVETDLSFTEANIDLALQTMGGEVAAQKLKVSPPAAKALSVPSSDEDDDADDEGGDDDGEDDEDENLRTKLPDGWSGSEYCKNVEYKGFEVDVPVTIDVTAAQAALPSRLPLKCYAGESCELRIPYPLGCVLDPLDLPEGLSLADGDQPDVASFDTTFNIVNFKQGQEPEPSAQTAKASSATLSVSGYEMATVNLQTSATIELGTTETQVSPSAECYGEPLDLGPVPIELIRDLSAALYQNLKTPIGSDGYMTGGQDVTIALLLENRGQSAISDGEISFTPPAGSVVQNAGGCFNYGAKILCRVENLPAGKVHSQSVTFKLPAAQIEDKMINTSASFNAQGLAEPVQAETVDMLIEGTGTEE